MSEFSQFTSLLAFATSLAADLLDRSSLSILGVPNIYLVADNHLSPAVLADILRYIPPVPFLVPDLCTLSPSSKLITMLLQTIGRATNNSCGQVSLSLSLLFAQLMLTVTQFQALNFLGFRFEFSVFPF